MDNSDNIPKTPKGRRATVAADQFPYHFPKSLRRMGDGFPVSEAKKRLVRFYYTHMMLLRTFAGWIIRVPEFEVKIELGHQIYAHAEATRLLRVRLLELLTPKNELNEFPDAWRQLHQELLHSHGAEELLASCHTVSLQLQQAEAEYLRTTDKLLDLPSIRILRIIQVDLDGIVEWISRAIDAYIKGGKDKVAMSTWSAHIDSLIRALGIFAEGDTSVLPPLRQNEEPPFIRQIGCERDERFTTFHETRDYRHADDLSNRVENEYAADRLDLIRVQRDEIDAIETFANVLFDLQNADFDLQMDLARFIWDESRHAEIGHQELERLGLEPFEVPCGIIGINVRSPLAPEIALAQISIFGELNIVGPMRRLSDRALKRGDHQTHITFDFIHSDEVLHLRRGRRWLSRLHPSGNLKLMEEDARVQAIRRLLEEGVIGEDYSMNLTATEIAALIGGE